MNIQVDFAENNKEITAEFEESKAEFPLDLNSEDVCLQKGYEAGRNDFGLKGKGQGELVHFDNVHPIEHKVEVGLRSKNLVNILAPDSIPSNGYDVLDDNSIRVYSNRGYTVGVKYSVYAPVGTTITMSYEYELGGEATGHYNLCITDNGAGIVNSTITKTIPASGKIEFEFARTGGSGNDKKGWIDIKNFQVEIGTTATAYAPYITDFSDCKVKASGKNLVDITKPDYIPSNSGEIIDKNTYRVYANSGVAVSEYYYIYAPKGTKLTVSFDYELGGEATNKWFLANDVSGLNSGTTWTVGDNGRLKISFGRTGGSGNNKLGWVDIKNLQVEASSSLTEYEPYTETEYTTNADGTVEGVKSISPVMNILADKAGAVINAECFLDANAVAGEIKTALINLGGEL